MIQTIPIEVLLAAGYAVFLVVVAIALERLARHSHQRSEQFQVAGFKYHLEPDHWECPAGQHLKRKEIDRHQRVVRYQAPAHICNQCSFKPICTDSDTGREIDRHLDAWLDSELQRFHRGISLALIFLAVLILVIAMVRHNRLEELLLPAVLLVPIGGIGSRLARTYFREQSTRIGPALGRSLDG
ncbi:MAG TPA: hypothetical protein VG028_08120 [Terriglobia bacterium]|nr:hypothetical protein [Terriglobia bacterium]